MSNANEELVKSLFRALTEGNMDKAVAYLTEDVFYHNVPWEPVIGRAAVKEVLNPFIDTPHGGLDNVEYLHSLADGNIVMNAREETWRHKDVTVVLPTAGVFEINDGLISRWSDYWNEAHLQPIFDLQPAPA
jgi:limonene-1,2-epoxide hydrolase